MLGLPKGVLNATGALLVGPSKHAYLFAVELTLDLTLENWYHFIKPICHIKNLLTMSEVVGVHSAL
jgi:hypothetical protein